VESEAAMEWAAFLIGWFRKVLMYSDLLKAPFTLLDTSRLPCPEGGNGPLVAEKG